MMEISEICEHIEHAISHAREKATARHWGEYSRHAFVNNLSGLIPELDQLVGLFRQAHEEITNRPEVSRPELSPHINELKDFISVLKRNKEMEESRIEKMKSEGIQNLAETITVPELYADLEQKTLSLLLKSTYAVERMRVFIRKQKPAAFPKAGQRSILDLLEQREKELEDLRKKYDESRQNTFLGMVEKQGAVEIENELNEIARKLESRTALMHKLFESTKDNFTRFQAQMNELEQRINNIEELESQITGKTFELITLLKKERDYTKKVLIEIEHETIQLRNTYSKELIGLQEEKLGLRNSLEEKHAKEMGELKHEFRHKNEMLSHMRQMVDSKEKKIEKLQEEIDRLELLNKTYSKHHTVKEHFKKKHSKK